MADDPRSEDRMSAIAGRLRRFRTIRGWDKFDSLKDLAAAISIEAAELQEVLLWQPFDEDVLREKHRRALQDELADVVIHVLNFADYAGIDIVDAVEQKLDANEARFPPRDLGRPPSRSDSAPR